MLAGSFGVVWNLVAWRGRMLRLRPRERDEAGLQKVLDGVAAAERGRDPHEARHHGADGQDLQRNRHRLRRLVRAVPFTVAAVPAYAARRVASTVRTGGFGVARARLACPCSHAGPR